MENNHDIRATLSQPNEALTLDEYIEREALITYMQDNRPLNWCDTEAEMQEQEDWERFIKILEAAPAADVAPVVRCRDCEWFGTSPLGGGWCNEVMARPMPYYGFCSYEERKEGDDHAA